jgi:predicted phage tail protein
MTKVYIKGILGKKFGSFFNLNISSGMHALKAIEANRSGFTKELFDLNKKDINYILICDGYALKSDIEFVEKRKINTIHIVPIIFGSGEVIAAGIGLAAGSAAAVATATLVNIVIGAAISIGVSMIMAHLNKQAQPPQQNVAVGGLSASIEAKGKTYIFSNSQNTVAQGVSIPVGYGKFKTNSAVIEASVKSYSTNTLALDEFTSLENESAFLDYLTD